MKAIIYLLLMISSSLLVSACDEQPTHNQQGYVEAELIYIASSITGKLEQLNVQRGEQVKRGQPLFNLDEQPQLEQLHQAKANLENALATLKNLQRGQRETILEGITAQIQQAQAQVELAQLQLQRNKKLYTRHAIDQNTLDESIATYKQTKAQLELYHANLAENKRGSRQEIIMAQRALVKSAQAGLKQARWSYQQKAVTSPTDAIVYDTYYRQGELVPQTSAVLSLLTPSTMDVIFYVAEPLLAKLQLGQVIHLRCDNCDANYDAKISYISSQAEYTPPLIYSEKNNYKLVFTIKARLLGKAISQLHPGQPVYVQLSRQQLSNDKKANGLQKLLHKAK